MANPKSPGEELPLRQAVEWYWELAEGDVSAARIAEWQAWLNASSRNSEAYSRIERTLDLVDQAQGTPWPSAREIEDDEYEGQVPIAEWRDSPQEAAVDAATLGRPSARARPAVAYWALAASVAIALIIAVVSSGLLPWFNGTATASYATRVAEHRDVKLSDGSTITLGAKSLLAVVYTREERRVILEQGQAYFVVAQDVDRPFVVNAAGREISAVGTAFTVTHQQQRVVVTVTEGTVLVTPETPSMPNATGGSTSSQSLPSAGVRLEVGHRLTYGRRSTESVIESDAAEAVAWRDGQLRYRRESLRYVIEDVNRYVERPVIVGDDAAGDILFTGTVLEHSIPAWLKGLEQAFPVTTEETPEGLVVRSRTDTSR